MRFRARTIAMAAFAFLLVPALSANDAAAPAGKPADESANSTPSSRVDAQPAVAEKAPIAEPSAQAPEGVGAAGARHHHNGRSEDTSKVDLFLGYTYLRGAPFSGSNRIVELNGGSTSLAYNFNDWFGIAGDFGGFADTRLILNGPGPATREVHSDGKVFTYLIGPRFSYRRYRRITPFAQVLIGAAHATVVTIDGCTGDPACSALSSDTEFALTVGAGLDVNVSRHFALRLFQAEYMMTFFHDVSTNPQGDIARQDDVRLSSGIVFRFGGHHPPPPPPNRPPVASCSSDKSMVYVGSGDMATVTATASDPDNDPLTYTWTASGGHVDGSGPQVRWQSGDSAVGNYTVTLHVEDGRGGMVNCSADIRVDARQNHPPTMTCSADRASVFAGERVHITGVANDPDNDPLTYTWRSSSGRVVGSGGAVDWDSSGLGAGNYTVTGRADDGRGGAADCSAAIEVKPMPKPPMATKINECAFGTAMSTRIDNVCKRILDDVALRLQNEPRASAMIIGYSDTKERRPEKVAGDRSANAVKYLGEKGIDASRIKTRTGSGDAGAPNNRRIEVIWVPEGATY